MINYLKGEITVVTPKYIVLETQNIGYECKVPNPFKFSVGAIQTLYTYLAVREDDISLYGFAAAEEKELFLKLISVKGIGPKGALAILAHGSLEDLKTAINSGNARVLQSCPGIGPKAASQIILDLSGKLDNGGLNLKVPESAACTAVREALSNMGYKTPEIKGVMPLIAQSDTLPLDQLIRLALKNINHS